MDRFKAAYWTLIFACTLAAASAGYASIEVDEEEVIFRFEYPGAAKVYLAGDFNNWNPTMDGMVKRDGAWEVRLYLVPGKYRYMFVVDGENIPDPDNPNRDRDGNTFFIFIEEDGVYDIIYEVTETGERKIDEVYTLHGALTATAVEDYGLFTASAGVNGEIEGSLRGNILIGAEYETTAEDPIKAYLVRAKGEWVTEKFRLGAFHRSGRVGLDDPLSLFTDVGPYAYPLDLFCRGVEVSAGWKNSVEGRVFFANRIDGYRSVLEDKINFWFDGNPEDKDMIGASLKGSIKPVKLEYMFRHDRGPGVRFWQDEGRHFMDRYQERTSHGLLLEFERKDWPRFKIQYLTGQTRLNAHADYDYYHPESNIRSVYYKMEWEEGYRALAEVSWLKGPFLGLLGWNRTTIKRNPELTGPHDWDDTRMDIFDTSVKYTTDRMKIDLKVDLIEFGGDGGMGRTFWFQGPNFWLDGDILRTELLQFVDSKRMWRAALSIEEDGVGEIPGPYRLEGYLIAKANWDGDEARSMFEISGGKGIRAGSFLSLHADLRYISYSDDRWVGDGSFLDFWAGLRGNMGGTGWIALGIGVAPHRFDRWYFDFTGEGRESYLLEQDLFRWVTHYSDDYLLEELGRAEKSLSEEWRLSFEGGFSF